LINLGIPAIISTDQTLAEGSSMYEPYDARIKKWLKGNQLFRQQLCCNDGLRLIRRASEPPAFGSAATKGLTEDRIQSHPQRSENSCKTGGKQRSAKR
jgi:hypothetical protein